MCQVHIMSQFVLHAFFLFYFSLKIKTCMCPFPISQENVKNSNFPRIKTFPYHLFFTLKHFQDFHRQFLLCLRVFAAFYFISLNFFVVQQHNSWNSCFIYIMCDMRQDIGPVYTTNSECCSEQDIQLFFAFKLFDSWCG